MDINFHYFAVKSLAVRAGFSAADAQTLAEYSQFVDDYNRTGSVLFQNVPEFARHLAKKDGSNWRLQCVTTGFSSFLDMAELVRRSRQQHICIPFHFIPPQALNAPVADEAAWRTEPETLQKPTVLRCLLEKAENRYKQAPAARESLIGLAILLHIFADTYAHQRFSGFGGWWNHGSVIKEQCNTGKRLRIVSAAAKRLGSEAKGKHALPSIFVGHMSFGHAPDKSSLCFTARQKQAQGRKLDLEYTRDNTEVFLEASRTMLNFMRRCRAMAPVPDSEWKTLSDAMRQGFLTQEADAKLLAAHWHKQFPDIAYDYGLGKMLKRSLRVMDSPDERSKRAAPAASDEEDALERLFSTTPPDAANAAAKSTRALSPKEMMVSAVTDDFFWFNVFAKEIRDAVNGVVTPLK